MHKIVLIAALGAALALPACTQRAANIVGGGALGALTAEALGGDDEWIVIGALAGAGAGSLVARNSRTGNCAYARGNGTFYQSRCSRY